MTRTRITIHTNSKNMEQRFITWLSIMLVITTTSCNPFFSKSDIIFEQDYCGWKVVGYQFDANLNVNCPYFIIEKDMERKEVYVTEELSFKYGLGDTICYSKPNN